MPDPPDKPDSPSSLPSRIRRSLQLSPGRMHRLERLDVLVAVIYFAALILHQGYELHVLDTLAVDLMASLVLYAIMFGRVALDAAAAARLSLFLRRRGIDLAFLALPLLPKVTFASAGLFLAARVLLLFASRLLRSSRGQRTVLSVRQHPARIIALSFLLTIATGTLFLTFPGARTAASSTPLMTALFTAASAVCVTGLAVVDTGTYWTGFGQVVIMILIQIGGLGIMTLSASAFLVFGRTLGAGTGGFMSEVVEETVSRDISRLLQFILVFTFAIELVAAAVLALHWTRTTAWPQSLFLGLFHSVSAFNNAGFSTFPKNLEEYVGDPVVNLVICLLIILGGLGFTVNAALAGLARRPRRYRKWWREARSHTKLVLLITSLLIAMGAVGIFVLERGNSLAGLPLGHQIWAAIFQSVTPRTAGFNTVPIGALGPATVTLIIVLMFIGGSPGGTAGGIKTTTIGILAFAFRSLARNRPEVEVFNRRLGVDTLNKAVAVTLLSGVFVMTGFTLLLLSEPRLAYPDLLFESVSAFGTVGLSRGITPSLTVNGQLIIITLMFVGRTGPLTLAFALGRRAARSHYRYPEARILVG